MLSLPTNLDSDALDEIDIEDSGEGDDSPLAFGALTPSEFDVSNRRIRDLHRDFKEQDLDPRPAFQRGYVWDKARASRLIESVLLNVPLPLIYTAEEADGREVVIDGQQRLTTFFSFIDGRFQKDDTPFRLTGLKLLKDHEGRSYKTLPEDARRDFLKYNVSIIKIGAKSHPDVRFEIFERLNTGSISLSEQELRNCLHRGPLNELLKELAGYASFQKCMGITRAMPRMRDVEMVLRFIAFYDRTHLNYTGKMKSFLNKFMSDRKEIQPEKQAEYREVFRRAADITLSVFGDRAFRRYTVGDGHNQNGRWESSVNKALFDAVMWVGTRFEKRQILPVKDEIRERLIALMTGDQEFIESVTLATADLPKIKYRFERWLGEVDAAVRLAPREKRLFSYALKQRLFEQNATCALCHQRIETLDDAEVDHHLPYADGGVTEESNARLAHRYCNRARRGEA